MYTDTRILSTYMFLMPNGLVTQAKPKALLTKEIFVLCLARFFFGPANKIFGMRQRDIRQKEGVESLFWFLECVCFHAAGAIKNTAAVVAAALFQLVRPQLLPASQRISPTVYMDSSSGFVFTCVQFLSSFASHSNALNNKNTFCLIVFVSGWCAAERNDHDVKSRKHLR